MRINFFKKTSIAMSFVFICLAPAAQAALSPISVGLMPPVQFPPADFSITGVRASLLYGHHRDLYGIDLGLLGNITDQSFNGLAVSGIFNYTNGTTNIIGLQFTGLTNINTNKTTVVGLQAALGLNYNKADSSVYGVQFAIANISSFTTINGIQVGVYNSANTVNGLQIGLVNVTKNLHGVQIGLLNFNNNGLFVVSPILNVGF